MQVVGGTFERALFDTIDMGEEGEGTGRYRVRVVGGLVLPEASRGTAVLEFDNRGTLSKATPTGCPSCRARPPCRPPRST
ncbi:MAG: hypothetical protein M5U28_31795 [Sandaracinaceae bacterium]|nr:hypothetical protein [Sandaracinaceae bacterium]